MKHLHKFNESNQDDLTKIKKLFLPISQKWEMKFCPDEKLQENLFDEMYQDERIIGWTIYSFKDTIGVKVYHSFKLEDEILDLVFDDVVRFRNKLVELDSTVSKVTTKWIKGYPDIGSYTFYVQF